MPYTGKKVIYNGRYAPSDWITEQNNFKSSIEFFSWPIDQWKAWVEAEDAGRVAVWKLKSLKPKNDNNAIHN